MAERVVVAMSGGVDSSLAAALLVEQGYDVVGVSMRLWEGEDPSASGCCTLDDFLDARAVADRLGIPFYVMDFRDVFRAAVVDDFVAEYRAGRTPNPCARCNQFVKFAVFWERARALGAARIATGHYAQVRAGGDGVELWRGADADKDQSYFLFSIGVPVLARTLFPVGGMRKAWVRAEAERRGLPVARKPDSQEVCFAPRGTHAAFVEAQAGGARLRAGAIVDRDGVALGRHRGVHGFTIGQRRGLGLAGGPPRFVTAIDAARGEVRVGDADDVLAAGLVARGASWLAPPPRPGTAAQVQIRSRAQPQVAWIEEVTGDGFTLRAAAPLRAVTPGQAAVLYDGPRVLGGGWISAAIDRDAAEAAAPSGAAAREPA